MNILICSKLFYPANEIGAVRITNLAKFLSEFGHDVTVVAGSSDELFASDESISSLNIQRVSHSPKVVSLMSKIQRTVAKKETIAKEILAENNRDTSVHSKILTLFRNLRLQVYSFYLQVDWFRQVKKIANGQVLDKKYDVVISSFGPLGSHLAGRFFKKVYKARYWIADLRDNMQAEEYPSAINFIFKYFEKDMVRKADAITVVSRGQRDMLQNKFSEYFGSRQQVHVVYNGYQKISNSLVEKKYCEQTGVLKIVYTGALYNGKRDMSILFKAIKELSIEKKIRLEQVEVHYAGKNSSDLYKQASKYGIEDVIKDHGYVAREDSIRLQNSAHALIVLSWNTQKEQGILSGKFFEYIQAGKPIISLVNGNLPGAELSEMVKELNVGISFELINEEADWPVLKNYLCALYNSVIHGVQLEFSPDIAKIQSYEYMNIARKFEEVCLNLLQK